MSIILRGSGLSQKVQHLRSTFQHTCLDNQILRSVQMSEEIIQKDYEDHGLKIEKYQFYNLGSTTISTLKKYKIIPNKDYKEYEKKKPDALLVDRRNKSKPSVIAVIEYKSPDEFKTKKQKKEAVEQCNNYAQVLKAKIGIATDKSKFIWFNPNHKNLDNEYYDKSLKINRSYSIIKQENDDDFTKSFNIDQKTDENEITKLNIKTRESIETVAKVLESVSKINSKFQQVIIRDPTPLAKQIWQDVWSVTGKDPEKCLYTFVELFIFKYLSDLGILNEDKYGNKVNFDYIYSLKNKKQAFQNYSKHTRNHLKEMFEEGDDHTSIINGTILNKEVEEHAIVFHKILKKFDDFGEIRNIDPSFKSKVFEEFMKESISTKNWGRYFTPRNVIDAMIEMSDIEKLEKDSKICDPACGVGGFILEPMKVKKDVSFYYPVNGGKIEPKYQFYGFDKGFEKDEQLTIILAKANMLIFLSELLKNNDSIINDFADLFNNTFKLTTESIMGTLEKTEYDQYDLILTNPPYVTSGSSNYKERIKKDAELKKFYKTNAMGVEGLFVEWIINSIKPNRKALVVIPDGILLRMNDDKLRQLIKDECILDAIISLPVKTFYTTPKKTYILIITKKDAVKEKRKEIKQTEPVFTYLASSIGESLDVYRFTKDVPNDLLEAVCLFNQFKGSKDGFVTESKRCKIQPIEMFDAEKHWAVDRWWTREEKVQLGIEDEENEITKEEFLSLLKEKQTEINNLIADTEDLLSCKKN
jgi:type I restriction enzyme M protein